jgi:hypothetical protein
MQVVSKQNGGMPDLPYAGDTPLFCGLEKPWIHHRYLI